MTNNFIFETRRILTESINTKQAILQDETMLQLVQQCIETITNAFDKGHKVWFCGNGGSAADAQHLAAEFSGRFYIDRKPLPSEAFHCNSSYMTAVANDYGYAYVYSRMVDGLAQKGDVLVGLSTSGNSENIVNAFIKAKEKGVLTIGFTGADGGKMKGLSDILVNVPSQDTPRIQECHITLGHIVCQLVEEQLFNN